MKTAHRVLDVLEAFLSKKGEFSISELSKITGFNVTTVHRICTVLMQRGYLHQYMNRGKYSLGLKLVEYNFLDNVILKIKETAKPFLKELSRVASETVNMAFIDGNSHIDVF